MHWLFSRLRLFVIVAHACVTFISCRQLHSRGNFMELEAGVLFGTITCYSELSFGEM